jgi:hypothetical protein
MTIEVRIDRVVLDGVDLPPGQSRVLGEALEAELKRLLATAPHETLRESRHTRRIEAPSPDLDSAAGPERLGRDIAQSIHGGLIGPGGAR